MLLMSNEIKNIQVYNPRSFVVLYKKNELLTNKCSGLSIVNLDRKMSIIEAVNDES